MYLPSSQELVSVSSSIGMIALAGYVSSPTDSVFSLDSLPSMFGPTVSSPLTIQSQDLDEPEGHGTFTLWLKKPPKVLYGTSPKII